MEFTIYFADRKMNILGNASTKSTAPVQIAFDEEEDNVEVASAVYELTLDYSKEVDIDQLVDVGFYAVFVNEDGEGRFYTIIDFEKDILNRTVDLYMEDGGLDLINEEVGEYQATEAHTIDFYINKFTFDSGFEIGVNEIGNSLSRKLKWEGDSTVTKRLESIATQFDHAELNFSFEIKGMTITKKYINIYKKRGKDVGVRLKMGTDIHNILVSRSIANLATALNCEGGTPEGQEKPITLKGYKYDDGRFYVDGTYLKDRESLKVWSRYISPDEFGTDEGHLVKRYSYDTTSQSELCNRAVSELTKASQVEQNFEVDIAVLPKHCRVGDTVYIVDNDEKLYLQARILKLTRSRSRNEHKAVLGDYLIKESGINAKVQELADKIASIKEIDATSTWVRFADDAQGNGMSASPTNKRFIAIKTVLNNPVPSDDPADYAGLWIEYVGKDGIPGSPGADGKIKYTWIKYADNVSGGGMSDNPDRKTYIGMAYNKDTPVASDVASEYRWFLAKGADGKDGKTPIKGVDYFDGKDGQNGSSAYLHIRYSKNANGNPMTQNPTGALYIGTQVSQSSTESTNYADYQWTLIKGSDGTPGEKGADGKTSYLHIKYSNDGGKSFTENNGEDVGSYIGQYVDFVQTDSNSVSAYTWSLIKGEKGDKGDKGADGVAGKDGIGIESTVITYGLSTSDSTQPTTWTTTVPTLVKGQYLWTKTVWSYDDNTSETGYIKTYIAKDGNSGTDGLPGKDGVGIKNTTITYAKSTNGTTAPTSGWTTSVPIAVAGDYIWTKTVWAYTDNTTETGYSVGKIGNTGPKGDRGADGVAGKDGVGIKSTEVSYLGSSNGTTPPVGGWTLTVPSVAPGNYLWTRTVWTYTDTSIEIGYTVSRIGKDGNTGKDGIAGKDGVGIVSTTITYGRSTSGTSNTGITWTSTVPSVPAGEYLWTKTIWNYSDNTSETGYSVAKMGDTGAKGDKGDSGKDGKTPYFYIAWSDSLDGKTGFTINKAEAGSKGYLGTYSSINSAQSTNPADYAWIKLAGAFESELTELQNTINKVNKVVVQFEEPTQKNNTLWWKTESTTSDKIVGYYVWENNKWIPQTIEQSMLNIVELNAVEINGSTITGSSFLNHWNKGGIGREGVMRIEDGSLSSDYTALTGGKGSLILDEAKLLMQTWNSDGNQTSSLQISPQQMQITTTDASGAVGGIIKAEALNDYGWKTIKLASGYVAAENNPPAYKKTVNLDGTTTIKWRGQVTNTGGTIPAGGSVFFATNIPSEARPLVNEFSLAATSTANTGVRIAVLTDGRFQLWTQSSVGYVVLSGFTYEAKS